MLVPSLPHALQLLWAAKFHRLFWTPPTVQSPTSQTLPAGRFSGLSFGGSGGSKRPPPQSRWQCPPGPQAAGRSPSMRSPWSSDARRVQPGIWPETVRPRAAVLSPLPRTATRVVSAVSLTHAPAAAQTKSVREETFLL